MVQVLKEDVKQRIYSAAVEEFYNKDYKTATIRAIAERADVPTGLVYSYYKNKHALFESIVKPILLMMQETLKEAENSSYYYPFENFQKIESAMFLSLFDKRKQLIILIDKSNGTKYQDAREIIIRSTEIHIKNAIKNRGIEKHYDDFLIHILANNFMDGFFEIIRHYKNRKWAEEMLELMAKQYYCGVESLLD
jgi:AcrR family transcriptional regulator